MTPPRTTGVDGLPLYRHGEIPDGLATVTMLRDHRRRVAQGQKHVAWYLTYGGHGDHKLYRVDQATPMRPLRGRQAETYTWRRTCQRCGTVGIHALQASDTGRLLDPGCRQAEITARHRAEDLRARFATAAWARDVLADDQVVIVDVRHPAGAQTGRIHAATLDGAVLVDGPLTREAAPGLADQVRQLATRRIVSWDGPGLSTWWGRDVIGYDQQGKASDHFGPHLTGWLARRAAYGVVRQHRPQGADPRHLVATMRDQLAAMAADQHPDGPPGTCPALPETGLEPCGGVLTPSGVCEVHRRPLLLAALAGTTS